MAQIAIGANMEFVRRAEKPFAWGAAKAAELGFEYIEPMVHWGRELMSEAGYYHTVSMYEDPLAIREVCDKHNVTCSGIQAHNPLAQPDISVNYISLAIRFASHLGAPIVNTDEGIKPDFTDEETDHMLMRYTLTKLTRVAERHNVLIGLEPHQIYSQRPDGLDRIYNLVKSPSLGINFDTGNAYLAGQDPYSWLAHVRDRLVHVHAKDISVEHSDAERGKVTGTPVGCACGDGVIDWKEIIKILEPLDRQIVLSVECGTVEEAASSLDHLRGLL